MGIISGLFKSRDKPTDRTAGSSYSFFLGGTARIVFLKWFNRKSEYIWMLKKGGKYSCQCEALASLIVLNSYKDV